MEQYNSGFHPTNVTKMNGNNFTPPDPPSFNGSSYPDYVDWRTKNAVTPVKDQV